jgi:hypothetical protein
MGSEVRRMLSITAKDDHDDRKRGRHYQPQKSGEGKDSHHDHPVPELVDLDRSRHPVRATSPNVPTMASAPTFSIFGSRMSCATTKPISTTAMTPASTTHHSRALTLPAGTAFLARSFRNAPLAPRAIAAT